LTESYKTPKNCVCSSWILTFGARWKNHIRISSKKVKFTPLSHTIFARAQARWLCLNQNNRIRLNLKRLVRLRIWRIFYKISCKEKGFSCKEKGSDAIFRGFEALFLNHHTFFSTRNLLLRLTKTSYHSWFIVRWQFFLTRQFFLRVVKLLIAMGYGSLFTRLQLFYNHDEFKKKCIMDNVC
jgi:hypothetical protein